MRWLHLQQQRQRCQRKVYKHQRLLQSGAKAAAEEGAVDTEAVALLVGVVLLLQLVVVAAVVAGLLEADLYVLLCLLSCSHAHLTWRRSLLFVVHVVVALSAHAGIAVHAAEQALQAVLLLPPATIHEFAFLEGTDGFVASAAATSLKRLFGSEPEARSLLGAPAVLQMPASGVEAAALEATMRLAMREFGANLPGREFSLGAFADLIASWFVRAVRGVRTGVEPARDPRAGLVRRFIERVEARFQHHDPLVAYAGALGVSVPHLSRSCRELLGRSAARVIQDRLMIEARRDLVYTAMSISQISFRLGFTDPAYFSRFFARRAGVSPSDYRAKA